MNTQPDLGSALSPTAKLRMAHQTADVPREWRVGRKKMWWTAWLAPKRLVAIVVVVGTLATGAAVLYSKQAPAPAPAAEAEEAAPNVPGLRGIYRVAGGYWACKDEATLERVERLLLDKDQRALETMSKAGAITPLKAGQSVQWLGSSGFRGSRVKIRPVGSSTELWASREALR